MNTLTCEQCLITDLTLILCVLLHICLDLVFFINELFCLKVTLYQQEGSSTCSYKVQNFLLQFSELEELQVVQCVVMHRSNTETCAHLGL